MASSCRPKQILQASSQAPHVCCITPHPPPPQVYNRAGSEGAWATLFVLQHWFQGRLVQQEPLTTFQSIYTFPIAQSA